MITLNVDRSSAGWDRLADETEFTILNTRFFVSKLPAVPARVLWRRLMNEVAKTGLLDALGQMDTENPSASLLQAVKGVMALDANFLADMERQMFAHVSYAAPGMTQPRTLTEQGQTVAFDGFEQADVDELFARCFAVNFFASIRRHASRLGLGATESLGSSLAE